MSLDRFDEWLRGQVNDQVSLNDLSSEWSRFESRLDREKRRPSAIIWWSLGTLTLTLLLLFIWQPWATTQEVESDQIIPAENLASESDKELMALNKSGDEETSTVEVEWPVKETVSSQASVTFGSIEKEQIDVESVTRIVVQKNTSPSNPAGASSVDGLSGSSEDMETLSEDYATVSPNSMRIKSAPLDFLPYAKQLDVEHDWEKETITISQNNISSEFPKDVHAWSWSIQSHAGIGEVRFDHPLSFEEGYYTQQGRESWGFDLRAWRSIHPNWSFGAGLGMNYLHVQLEQGDSGIERVDGYDQVTQVIQRSDGSIERQNGSGQGTQFTEVDRVLHHEYAQVHLNLAVSYEKFLFGSWKGGAMIELLPGYQLVRRGTDMEYENGSWKEHSLSDRINNDITLGIGGQIYLGYELPSGSVLYGGIGSRYYGMYGSHAELGNAQSQTVYGSLGMTIKI